MQKQPFPVRGGSKNLRTGRGELKILGLGGGGTFAGGGVGSVPHYMPCQLWKYFTKYIQKLIEEGRFLVFILCILDHFDWYCEYFRYYMTFKKLSIITFPKKRAVF